METNESLKTIKIWKPYEQELLVTEDYSTFKMLPYNRNIDHEKRLISSVDKIGLVPIPIIVNERMEIVDGQHRFTACKTMGLPVYYIVVPGIGLKECSDMNSVSKNWSTMNHVHAYTSPVYEDNDSYIYYELLSEENQEMNPTMLSCMLAPLYKASGRRVRALIKQGKLKLSESDYHHITEKISWANGFIQYAEKMEGTMETFWEAISYLYEIEAVDNEKLKRCILKTDQTELSPVGKIEGCLDKLEKIYNKGAKKNRVYMRPAYDAFVG
jgi:hypothetical protein